MPKQDSIFERAAKAAQGGTSSECRKLIQQLQGIAQAEAADLAATKPPAPVSHFDGSGRMVVRSMGDAGERYRRAALEDDPEKLAAVTAEHARLDARALEIKRLVHALQAREKAAAADEAKAAAPKRAAAIVSEIEATLDTLEAAQAEYLQARADVERLEYDLISQRELIVDDAGTLSAGTFRRLGEAMAHMLRRHVTPTSDVDGRDTTRPHLFSSHERALQLARILLPAPSGGVLASIRGKLMGATSLNASDTHARLNKPHPSRMADELTAYQRERLRLITAGDVEAAEKLKQQRKAAP